MGRSSENNQVQTRRKRRRAKHFAAPATRSVALDGNSGMSTNGERHSGPVKSGIQQHGAPEDSTAHTSSFPTKSGELISAVESTDQADSRLRPFRRRAFNTARPARVDMRERKPCFFARRRLLGWNVRFTRGLRDLINPEGVHRSLIHRQRLWCGNGPGLTRAQGARHLFGEQR